jgi:hypothetical protein
MLRSSRQEEKTFDKISAARNKFAAGRDGEVQNKKAIEL